MKVKAPFLTPATINTLSIAIVACAIFVVDTQVHVDIDVPVLYVAVVLMATRLFEGRGILIVSLGCAVLAVAGYLLSLLGTCRQRFLLPTVLSRYRRSAPRLSLL